MLVAFPIGLWFFALDCDVIAAFGASGTWRTAALYSVVGGITGAVIAVVQGLIDYFSIDGAAMKRIATFHLVVNVAALLVFGVNLCSRFVLPTMSFVPLILSTVGVVGIGVGGWLGREMVYFKGMAVEAVEKLDRKVQEQEQPRLRRAS